MYLKIKYTKRLIMTYNTYFSHPSQMSIQLPKIKHFQLLDVLLLGSPFHASKYVYSAIYSLKIFRYYHICQMLTSIIF